MIIKIDKKCCYICNKNYASSNSLWNHNNKFHNDELSIKNQYDINGNQNLVTKNQNAIIGNQNTIMEVKINNKLNCKYCKKNFSHYNNKWRHEKTCKNKINEETVLQKMEKTIEELKKEVSNIKKIKKINIEKDILLKEKFLHLCTFKTPI